MNVQTELLENRIAHLIVAIENAELDQAKRQAARRLAKRVNIPGFRKGKAPYDIIVRYLGEGAVLEEAIDRLGPDIYREALKDSELEPYGPGQLENIEGEDQLTFVFSVPLTPTVDLGEYRDVRRDYEAQEATDEMVDNVLKALQDRKAVVEPKDGPATNGDQVALDLHGTLVPAEDAEDAQAEPASEEDGEEAADDADAQDRPHAEDPTLFDQTGWRFVLGDEDRELMPGFSAAIEGITAGEERSFKLTFPDKDETLDETLWGRTVQFTVTAREVSTRLVPPINDDFAQQADGYDVETLLELRLKIREDLQARLDEQTDSAYADETLTQIVEGATIEFPDMMVDEYVDDMIGDFKRQLMQQSLTLEDFLKFNQMEESALREQYREPATERLKRSLVLGKLVEAEELNLDDRAIDREVKTRSALLSEGNPEMQGFFEQYFGGEKGRRDLAMNLLTQHAMKRLIAIARGEDPAPGLPPVEDEPAAELVTGEAATESTESDENNTLVDTEEAPVGAGEAGEAAAEVNEEAGS